MGSKKKYASLWRVGDQIGITLHTPFLSLSLKDANKYETGHQEIKKIPLPRPMTSSQFNRFITSDEGKEWAKPFLEEAVQQKTIQTAKKQERSYKPKKKGY